MIFPKITAVITTYKRPPEMIMRAVKSVLNQTYPDVELIVVDDSPSDFPFRDAVNDALIALNDERIRYIRHEVNKGACAARNTGYEASKGEFLAFLDDDDEWLPEKLEKQMAQMTDETVGLVYCGSIRCYTAETTEVRNECKCISGMIFDELIKNNFVGSTSFPLIRKTCLDKLGGFDILMDSSQDYEMWLRIAEKYNINYVNECLVKYYIHEGEQITSNPIKKINGMERLILLHSEYLKHHKSILGKRTTELAPFYVRNKQGFKGNWYFIKGALLNFADVKYNYRQFKNLVRAYLIRSK